MDSLESDLYCHLCRFKVRIREIFIEKNENNVIDDHFSVHHENDRVLQIAKCRTNRKKNPGDERNHSGNSNNQDVRVGTFICECGRQNSQVSEIIEIFISLKITLFS